LLTSLHLCWLRGSKRGFQRFGVTQGPNGQLLADLEDYGLASPAFREAMRRQRCRKTGESDQCGAGYLVACLIKQLDRHQLLFSF
jgi:hypothetical protein